MDHAPFIFRDGQKAATLNELAEISIKANDSLYHLSNGHFEDWLRHIGLPELAQRVQMHKIANRETIEQFGWFLLEIGRETKTVDWQLKGLQYVWSHFLTNAPDLILNHLHQLQTQVKKLDRPDRHAVFFGVFNAGKSTLINALLGRELLFSHANRATGVITHIRFGEHSEAFAWLQANDEITQHSFQLGELDSYTKLDFTAGLPQIPSNIASVLIQLPTPSILQSWTLVDTLGLRDNEAFSDRTYLALDNADLGIAVLDATQLLSEDEAEAIEYVQMLLQGNLIVVINQCDRVNPKELPLLQEFVTAQLPDLGNPLIGKESVLLTAALPTLKGEGDRGISEIYTWLERFGASKTADQAILLARLGRLQHYAEQGVQALTRHQSELGAQMQAQKNMIAKKFTDSLTQFDQSIFQARQKLNNIQQNLSNNQEHFVESVTTNVRQLMNHTDAWQDQQKLQSCFTDALQAQTNQVNHAVTKALISIHATPSQFHLGTDRANFEIPEDYAAIIGGAVGGFVGLFFGGATFSIGIAAGSWLGKSFFGKDIKAETITSMRVAARRLYIPVSKQLSDYIYQVNDFLNTYAREQRPQKLDDEQLQIWQQEYQALNEALQRLQELQQQTKVFADSIIINKLRQENQK